jgi:hypothetical protein
LKNAENPVGAAFPGKNGPTCETARRRAGFPKATYSNAEWKALNPDVPDGDWYKDFETFKLCGTGKFPSTFLMAGQPARGKRL